MHLVLLTEENNVRRQFLVTYQPLGDGAFRTVSNQQQLGGHLAADQFENIHHVRQTLYRTEIREVDQNLLTLGREFLAAAFAGGIIGSYFGSKKLPPAALRRILALLLIVAAVKLIVAVS